VIYFHKLPRLQAYTEAVDSTSGAFSVLGRSRGSSNAAELYFPQSDVVFTYDALTPSTSCSFYSYASIPAFMQRTLGMPSASMFAMFNSSTVTKTYLGVSTDARTILCDKWLVQYSVAFGNIHRNYTATVYFAVAATSGFQEAVPVRVELFSPNTTANQTIVKHT
jgi:hypothetical protein